MSSSYVVKYTMNGDSQRPLPCGGKHTDHRTREYHECIMTIAIRLLVKIRGTPPHHKKTRTRHTNKW